ncbi:MAG: DUF4040 domain-containing protein [Rubrobacter sp.]|nr:DUF4040 domain-containing protein [Rubrobacter sp.]
MLSLFFDAVLALALPLLAWRVLTTRDLYRAVILFIAFGLLVALSWARLDAPDIALAEAAIGAGLTGALFLNTVGGLVGRKRSPSRESDESREVAERREAIQSSPGEPVDEVMRPWWVRLALTVPILALGLALGWAVVSFPEPAIDLAQQASDNLEASGVDHGVTAVLLNFRSYDTLLEIGVLLLAVVAVWSLDLGRVRGGQAALSKGLPVLHGLVRLLTPIMIIVGGYLLWAGAKQPGGAFQAGAVLGALGVLLVLSGLVRPPLSDGSGLRIGLAVGFAVFLGIGTAVMLATGELLNYPPASTYGLIIIIELFLTVSIALTLAALFVTAPPRKEQGSKEHSEEKGEES